MEDKLQFRLVRKNGVNDETYKKQYISVLKQIFAHCLEEDEIDILLKQNLKNELYVVCLDDQSIGITGLYWGDEDDICWLNWYGVLEPYRNQHYGVKVLQETFRLASQTFKGMRLYTDDQCETAIISIS